MNKATGNGKEVEKKAPKKKPLPSKHMTIEFIGEEPDPRLVSELMANKEVFYTLVHRAIQPQKK